MGCVSRGVSGQRRDKRDNGMIGTLGHSITAKMLLRIRVFRETHLCGSRIFDDGDERQIAITARCVEAVADDEFIWDDESGVVDY